MLKGDKRYIFFLSIGFIILITLQMMAPKPIDWRLSYLKKDKIPYGASALYSILPSLFQNNPIQVKNVPIYNVLKDQTLNHTNYIIINDKFEPDKLDVEKLRKFVKEGNTVFISANSFSAVFMDSLKFKASMLWNTIATDKKDSVKRGKKLEVEETIPLNFYNPLLKKQQSFAIEQSYGSNFTKFDTSSVTVLGNIKSIKINFIRQAYGKGYFYLHSTPEIFTNYHFLKNNNAQYVEGVFSYLPVQQLIWDDYYKDGKIKINDSPLRVIMNNPSLSTAYYLLIFSILIFMLIGIKRKQRIIPVIDPLNNTTMEFVDTVGALYYQQGSHKQIAEKQISHFLSFVKLNFRLVTSTYDDIFISKLAALSGIEREKIKGLFQYISYIKGKSKLFEQELLQLNKMIEDFYKLNKR